MTGLLYREISQTKPLSLVDEAAANLHRTSSVLLQEVIALLDKHHVSPQQYNILRILRGAGKKGLPCGDLAARMVSPAPDTTRMIDRMAARKWIGRARGSQDRRVVLVRIASSGLKLLRSLEKPVQKIQDRQFARLADPELRRLISFLEKLRSPKDPE